MEECFSGNEGTGVESKGNWKEKRDRCVRRGALRREKRTGVGGEEC